MHTYVCMCVRACVCVREGLGGGAFMFAHIVYKKMTVVIIVLM